MIEYSEFTKTLNKRIKLGKEFFLNLMNKVIDDPTRYVGLFRLSNTKTKIIQNVTQSNEIKFGDFMEEIVTEYIKLQGYTPHEKWLGADQNGDILNSDQLFSYENDLYLVEQKIRDDHDSTKKRGQFLNFIKKINLLRTQYPGKHIIGIMWFIDDSKKKNINYYRTEMSKFSKEDIELRLFYGADFFNSLHNGDKAWEELVNHLKTYRNNQGSEVLNIPDFDTSDEVYEALLEISSLRWRKLISNSDLYIALREELFPTGFNINRVKAKRGRT
jgi:hypothetical protein